jgi:hypothetical protein
VAILRVREVWRKPNVRRRRSTDLTADEAANVRKAVMFLRKRFGTATQLADALGVTDRLVERICSVRGRPGAAVAIRAARLAGVGVDEILAGAWPRPGACPYCGRP